MIYTHSRVAVSHRPPPPHTSSSLLYFGKLVSLLVPSFSDFAQVMPPPSPHLVTPCQVLFTALEILSLKKPHIFFWFNWSGVQSKASQFVTTAKMILVCSQGWEPLSKHVQIKSYWYSVLRLHFAATFTLSFIFPFFPLGEENGSFSSSTWPFVSGVCISLSFAVHRMHLYSPWSPFPVFSLSLLTLSCLCRLT